LVDLPGYGYAKVPIAVKEKWQKMMEDYLYQRKALCGLVLVMDSRHPLMPFDQQLIGWCQGRALPVHIILTKADKLAYNAAQTTLFMVKKQVAEVDLPISVQLFSSLKKQGIDEIHAVLDAWFNPPPSLKSVEI
jgi:GTP-binding protein